MAMYIPPAFLGVAIAVGFSKREKAGPDCDCDSDRNF
jgi:hypothetical protein